MRRINGAAADPRYQQVMSKLSLSVAVGALAVFAGSALAQGAVAPVDVRAAMQEQVNPAMLEVWEVGNNALDDTGAFVPELVEPEGWARLESAAEKLAAAGRAMAAGERLLATAETNGEVAEGEIAMSQVQKLLDADPQAFRDHATELATRADRLVAHAKSRNPAAGTEIEALNAVCEGCHASFWYAE